jgi:hypothetical protein
MVQPGVSALGKKNRTTFLPRKSLSETFLPFSSGKEKSGALSLISMRASPFRLPLYLTVGSFVMLAALALLSGQTGPAQSTRREAARKGPRAVALLELPANGKARLVPITVMFDGKFYDAGSYKASPIPMALQRDTVYEAVRTGVSQGLFTVIDAFHRGNEWVADGKWEPAGATPPKKRPPEAPAPRDDDQDKPPVLRRPGSEDRSEAGSETAKANQPAAPPANTPEATAPAPVTTSADTEQSPPDKDRPVLRRGKPSEEQPNRMAGALSPAHAPTPSIPAAKMSEQKSGAQMMPAISDAGGSEPRPYSYTVKPAEEQPLRKKMLALASAQIRDRARQLASEGSEPAPARPSSQKTKTPAIRSAQPSFEDTQFQIFDLSTSNEPVLVLTTKARFPSAVGTKSSIGADLQYYVALVAREDISGELHKAFSNVTDSRHLDILPRLELIDAVDADGDGRGELLFRQMSDKGSAFVIYRVIGDQLWALFQGTPE